MRSKFYTLPMNEGHLTIAEMANRTGLSAHTLRYYERIGLLDPIERAPSGHRRYSARDVAWVEFLTRLRKTGMPIRMMQHYARLRREGDGTLQARRELLSEHQRVIQNQINDLQQILDAILEKIVAYQNMEAEYERKRNKNAV